MMDKPTEAVYCGLCNKRITMYKDFHLDKVYEHFDVSKQERLQNIL